MKRTLVVVALLAIASLAGISWWHTADNARAADVKAKKPEKPELPPLAMFMRAKLAASEQVLDGIVSEDFDKIEKGAIRLQLITTAEEWKVSDDQNYLDQSAQFRRVLSRLKTQAQKKNLDGAALAYVEMTTSCIQCHKDIRKPATPDKPK